MSWYSKIQFYKSMLIAFWCINVVLICTTLVASFRFFQSNDLYENTLQNQQQVLRVLTLESEISTLSSSNPKTDDEVYELRKRAENLKTELIQILDLPPNVQEFARSEKWKISSKEWQNMRGPLHSWIQTKIEAAKSSFGFVRRNTAEMFFLGVFTLIFGILLPILAFALLTRVLLKAKKSLEEKLSVWMAQILQKMPQDGSNPWTNPVVWLEVFLATFEIFAPASRHPIILLLKDFIPTVRAEFAKAKTESKHGT